LLLAHVDNVAADHWPASGGKEKAPALVPHLTSLTVPDSAAARAAARVAAVGRSSSSAPSRTRRSDENTFGGGRSDTPLPPSAATEVKDGALDILEALGVCVALGISELGRRVLYNNDVSPHLFVVHLL